jgi:hypothetical protein
MFAANYQPIHSAKMMSGNLLPRVCLAFQFAINPSRMSGDCNQRANRYSNDRHNAVKAMCARNLAVRDNSIRQSSRHAVAIPLPTGRAVNDGKVCNAAGPFRFRPAGVLVLQQALQSARRELAA